MQLFHRAKRGEAGIAMLGGLGLGALLMYVLDPQRGARRRALVRDKAVRLYNKTGDVLSARSRDWSNRSKGVAAKTRSLLHTEPASDDVLAERVRSRIGRAVGHPGSLEVSARDGRVTVSGPVLAREVDELLGAIRSTPGVEEVQDRLDVREHPGDEPGLQGESREERETF